MSSEGTKQEMTIGGMNCRGDVCDVQIRIMRESLWD